MTISGMIMASCFVYFLITAYIIINIFNGFDVFNPIRNYKKWTRMNWFGVGLFTLLIDIVFLPYIIGILIYAFVYWVFTTGRKN